MKVFLDTNIMIDLLAERKMWLLPASEAQIDVMDPQEFLDKFYGEN